MHWWINIGANQGRQCVFLSFGRFPPSGCLAVVWSAASQRPPPHTSQLSSRLSLGVWRWWATLQNAVSLFSQRVTFTSWLESGNIVFGVKITTCFSCRCAEVSLKNALRGHKHLKIPGGVTFTNVGTVSSTSDREDFYPLPSFLRNVNTIESRWFVICRFCVWHFC